MYIKKTDNPNMGRPSKGLSQRITIRIDDETMQLLTEYSKRNGKEPTAAAREMIVDFLKQEKRAD